MKLLLLLVLLPVFAQAETLTNQGVIQLVKDGTPPDELLRAIATAPTVSFNLMPTDTDQLMKTGVSEDAIKIMAARQNGKPLLAAQVTSIPMRGDPEERIGPQIASTQVASFILRLLLLRTAPRLAPVVEVRRRGRVVK